MDKFQSTINVPAALSKSSVTVSVKATGLWRVRLGLWLIQLGCKISGLGYKEDNNAD